jgi:hypothetical protein
MAWACCKNGWCKDSRKEVTGRQARREKKREDLRNTGVKRWRTRALDRTE